MARIFLSPSFFLLLTLVASVAADPTDWVSVDYFGSTRNPYIGGQSSVKDAEKAVVRGADKAHKRGRKSVANERDVASPSGDRHDYLSWAPYHWPDCNWCGSGRGYYGGEPDNTTDPDAGDLPASNRPNYQTGDSWHDDTEEEGIETSSAHDEVMLASGRHRRMLRSRRHLDRPAVDDSPPTASLARTPDLALDRNTTETAYGLQASIQVAAKKPSKTDKTSKCTPSPTKEMAPSATWTTCPYKTRDGKVNPDVRKLNGPGAINDFSQMSIYDAMAFVITRSGGYVDSLVKSIQTFYIDDATRMNPHMEYGQVRRGPGKEGQQGSFAGILDGRGHIKTVNAIMLVKALHPKAWTNDIDKAVNQWMAEYTDWMTKSSLGKKALTRPNNHGTFFAAQLAATKLVIGDTNGARDVINHFFDNEFQDQISSSGEQPFEAVRTRPFHYRCFNLEGLIVLAKIAEEVGVDVWSKRSKRGATIQDAVDFTMRVDPKKEDVHQLVPLVVSVSRAYGDPQGRYAAFLSKSWSTYRSKPFWLYNQAPSQAKQSKRTVEYRRDDELPLVFGCPSIFDGDKEVELDLDLFVSCAQLKPFFEGTAGVLMLSDGTAPFQ
ncbi:chondroitin AC/alginate lyase [Cylindrobasidium torrendii FP15055 ss-10]|uniref:Chondroitin AC/alginate lyase n=1 Tax=Cylindrobasidium torrendii FP15055 ss-10 TaxID=1314674 RepID=A0A0D7BT56_9AGAR|nr:chondroitin AC/alginate lyase [Cylindrobasidium torrendii FP15055 ss-10]